MIHLAQSFPRWVPHCLQSSTENQISSALTSHCSSKLSPVITTSRQARMRKVDFMFTVCPRLTLTKLSGAYKSSDWTLWKLNCKLLFPLLNRIFTISKMVSKLKGVWLKTWPLDFLLFQDILFNVYGYKHGRIWNLRSIAPSGVQKHFCTISGSQDISKT